MLDFHPVTIADRQWALPLLRAEDIPLCDYSFTSLFCWQHVYQQELSRLDDRVLVRAKTDRGTVYLWPAGTGDPVPALLAIREDARRFGNTLCMVAILPRYLPALRAVFGEDIRAVATPENYDYLYSIHRLADLPGKKLHAKRNHIRRFRDNCPEGQFLPLSTRDIPDCLELDRLWYEERIAANGGQRDENLYMERAAMVTALNYFEPLGLDGGLIRCGGRVLAFTLGTRITDTVFDVSFERARTDFQGAFPVINQEFARYLRNRYPELTTIDREEDLGNPGLRRAKLSYYPDELVETVCVLVSDH